MVDYKSSNRMNNIGKLGKIDRVSSSKFIDGHSKSRGKRYNSQADDSD